MIHLKPTNLNFEAAAALPIGGMTALFLLEKANISEHQKVLIYGASGSVGSYGVQLAKIVGASVTGVCSTSNIELVKSLGADNVIDYTKDDYRTMFVEYEFDIQIEECIINAYDATKTISDLTYIIGDPGLLSTKYLFFFFELI